LRALSNRGAPLAKIAAICCRCCYSPSTKTATELTISGRHLGEAPLAGGRRFADGLSSWLVRRLDGMDKLAVFDRPAGSERDHSRASGRPPLR